MYMIDIIIVILEGLEKREKRRNIGALNFCVVLLMGNSRGLVDAKVFFVFLFLFKFLINRIEDFPFLSAPKLSNLSTRILENSK